MSGKDAVLMKQKRHEICKTNIQCPLGDAETNELSFCNRLFVRSVTVVLFGTALSTAKEVLIT